jgi:hypothetical protein
MAQAFLRYEYNEIELPFCEDCQCFHALGQHNSVFPMEAEGIPIESGTQIVKTSTVSTDEPAQ